MVLTPITHMWVMYNPQFIRNELVVSWCLGARNTPPWSHGSTGPGSCTRHPGGRGAFLLSRLAQVLRGRAVVTRTSFLGLVATLSSRDASRSARRKRTGCVEPYEIRSTRSPALPARTEHPQGWAGRASELPIFRKDRIFLGRKGRVVLTPITHMWVMYNPQFIRNELVVSWCLGARNTPPWSHGSTGPRVVHQAPWRKGLFSCLGLLRSFGAEPSSLVPRSSGS